MKKCTLFILILLAAPVMANENIDKRIKELQAEGQQIMNNKQQAVNFVQQADVRLNQIAGALDELNKFNTPLPTHSAAETAKEVDKKLKQTEKKVLEKTGDKNWDEEK